ncbi:Thioesterase/thiol ester dehydrase-isomerase [Aulographum hederae CBS 113979]|uniref:Thioesterase/thiol ester dehydrase-isomerase n=1 Tax=Aulographum hederae CBS 113979 TaxID=1176131 RepID=A0A6G1GU36_9PEZI|nr:Thioesterase/thiol ester dehydrase-isomerase [Aulographum hederae CBS 113979]
MASVSAPNDPTIQSHIRSIVSRNLPNSPIYNFLLSTVSITHASKGIVRARLELTSNHVNSKGGLHGSVSATIVDWVGGMAIVSWDLREKTGVSVDIHVTYQSSAREGDTIEIEGVAERVGGNLAFTKIKISKVVDGEVGPIVATGTHTKFVKVP